MFNTEAGYGVLQKHIKKMEKFDESYIGCIFQEFHRSSIHRNRKNAHHIYFAEKEITLLASYC